MPEPSGGFTLLADAPLEGRNTLRVAARADLLVDVRKAEALPGLLALPALRSRPLLVLGEGSNILFSRDWPGTVLCMATRGIHVLEDGRASVRLRVEAGENWNDFVRWTLGHGLAGLENLVLIPGTVGAAPIQNIGAYGVEVAEFIEAVEAFDREAGRLVRLDARACAFGYRDSLFKQERGRYIVTAVVLELPRERALRMDYAGIAEELAALGGGAVTRLRLAEAIARLRTRKLPDPAVIANAGSFFKNPFVTQEQALALRHAHPGLPCWPGAGETSKLSAAWLIDSCGFKGLREGDAGIYHAHALVLVNHGNASGSALLALARRVADTVKARFGVTLEAEPLIL